MILFKFLNPLYGEAAEKRGVRAGKNI